LRGIKIASSSAFPSTKAATAAAETLVKAAAKDPEQADTQHKHCQNGLLPHLTGAPFHVFIPLEAKKVVLQAPSPFPRILRTIKSRVTHPFVSIRPSEKVFVVSPVSGHWQRRNRCENRFRFRRRKRGEIRTALLIAKFDS